MRFLFVFLFILLTTASFADDHGYKGEIKIVIKELPKFEDYKVDVKPFVRAKDIDWKTSPNAKSFQTRLREGLSSKSVIAGKYAPVFIGCGTVCGANWIINLESGKILGIVDGVYGFSTREDSALIVADYLSACAEDKDEIAISRSCNLSAHGEPKFYIIENDELKKIGSLDYTKFLYSAPDSPNDE